MKWMPENFHPFKARSQFNQMVPRELMRSLYRNPGRWALLADAWQPDSRQEPNSLRAYCATHGITTSIQLTCEDPRQYVVFACYDPKSSYARQHARRHNKKGD
ncbi:hypothetical protein [Trueperella bialowiezensis]|uniref:Uncharacterized protein n=1 Tax=Trueperella bialowiezensis TaxID=312285 RepID=A0A3S4VFX2_9ACTO|nr:hypothetical protein [Trueperella bialowiezensis]VEI13244.1 Uncharacterised protein [Trueperella bialowiezensis]